MKAEDTVIEGMQFLKIAHESGLDAAAQAQAEASFKAGIKEVVEWINAHARDSYAGRPLVPDWTAFKSSDWQAKLKEWGI